MNTQSSVSTINLEHIHQQVVTGKQRHVTITNTYVVARILKWSNLLFLLSLITAGLLVYCFVDEAVTATLADGLKVARSIINGYELGMQSLESRTSARESVAPVFATLTKLFYSIPFKIIDELLNEGIINKLLPFIAEASNLHNDLFDLGFLLCATLRSIPLLNSVLPYEYVYDGAHRFIPFTVIMKDHSSNNSTLNGEYIDHSPVMPSVYKKSFMNGNASINNVIYMDGEYWYLYQIETTTKSVGKITSSSKASANYISNKCIKDSYSLPLSCFQLKIVALRFYYPLTRQFMQLCISNSSENTNNWSISLHKSWEFWKIYQPNANKKHYVSLIQPMSFYTSDELPICLSNQISQVQFYKIQIHVEDDPSFNGIYVAQNLDKYWKHFGLFHSDPTSYTNFYRQVIHNNSSRTLYHLSHSNDNNKHVWTLQSHHIVMLSRSTQTIKEAVSPDTIIWQKYEQQNNKDKQSINYNLKMETKQQKLFESPYIHKVILFYSNSKQSEQERFASAIVEPYLAFKFDKIYLRWQTRSSNTNGNIIADVYNIQIKATNCQSTPFSYAYLKLKPLNIHSEMLGGHVRGYLDVFFRDNMACVNWVNTFNENLAQEISSRQSTKNRIQWMCKNDPKHSSSRLFTFLCDQVCGWL